MTGDATGERAAHPLVDAVSPGCITWEHRGDVLALGTGLSDVLHRATLEGVRTLVVTPAHTRLTPAAASALEATGGAWVVRTEEAFYDARTGRPLANPPDIFTGSAPGPAHARFLASPVRSHLQLVFTGATRHRVSRPVRLGGAVEGIAGALGIDLATWGATEPLAARWSRDDVTERTRRRMPDESLWALAGRRADETALLATLRIARTREGLEETTRAWVDAGSAGARSAGSLADDATAALRAAAGHGMPLIALAMAAIGAPDRARRASAPATPQPLALLLGPPAVAALRLPDAVVHDARGERVGSPRLPGLLFRLGDTRGGGWDTLARVLGGADADALTRLLQLDPAIAQALREADPEGGDDARSA